MAAGKLERVVGVPGAVLLGLGSILGTGIFVSIGVAAGVAGQAVVLAVVLAAFVATFNGLSSAQLAASHPVSGGTYEYGYRYLNPALGFVAGWLFLLAKSASAATAALGFAGYTLHAFGRSGRTEIVALALVIVVVLTLVVAGGLRRSSRMNAAIVSLTLLSLGAFALAALPAALERGGANLVPLVSDETGGVTALLHATALMFVAYTGYGRIATMGEEVREPRRTIPRAMVATLLASMVVYAAVSAVAVGAAGAISLAEATAAAAAPLETVARGLGLGPVAWIVAIGAITAMLGVLLNLLLGLSRVLLAMSRRGDMPGGLARIEAQSGSPRRAVLVMGGIVAALVLIGNVHVTWSFSAFTVLVYYALTNLAALRVAEADRLFPRAISVAGLISCLGLAFWVDTAVWVAGLAVIAVGLLWHLIARRRRGDG